MRLAGPSATSSTAAIMLIGVPGGERSGSWMRAMSAGFAFAHELGQPCSPLHLLVGVAEGDDAAAAALSTGGEHLRMVVEHNQDIFTEGKTYLQAQAQGAARMFAEDRGEPVGAEHLLVALLDQATPEVLEALRRAGIDRVSAREAVLIAIGELPGLPPVRVPRPTPAGTMDRPALSVEMLDPRAWAALRWRHEHLPLARLRHRSDWGALSRLESASVFRVASKLGLDDDQLYSLLRHHSDEVGRRAALLAPSLVPVRLPRPTITPVPITRSSRRRSRPGFLTFTYGWGTWFKNRRGGLEYRWFRLRAAPYYRGAPEL